VKQISRLFNLILVTSALIAVIDPSITHAEELSKSDVDFFEKKIRPVLVKHCYECHSAKSKELGGKLLLDSRDGILQGGESGPALISGKPNESLIVQSMRYEDTEMPPEEPLPETVVNDFVSWITRGAPDPRFDKEAVEVVTNDAANLDTEKHWSFYPRQSTENPTVRDEAWPRDPIDHYVLAKIEEAKLSPTGDAPPHFLIRRLYYDLLGLPPTAEQVEAFVIDHGKDGQKAVERLVDSLLAMPQFGERWGRHWLDVARYGESNGNDGLGRNASFPHAWRFRDYVIRAFNEDTPYDRFLTEQIAGDLLPAESAEQRNRQLIATGFLAIGAKPASAMNKNFAMDIVDDQINVVSTAVMGLSVACARCHDHKHDPIPTRDYYAMAGIFNSTETLYGKAANEKLTAPPTPLHQLSSKYNKDAPKSVVLKQTPKFPDNYSAVIDEQKPAFHGKFDSAPEFFSSVEKTNFSNESYAAVDNSRLVGEFAGPSKSYSVSFWFKNDMGNDKRPITAYLFSRAAEGAPLTGDHIGIGGTHDKSRSGKLFVFNGSTTKKSVVGETVVPSGSWNHIVLVRDGDKVRLHLNGVSEAEVEAELAPTFGESKTFFLATRSDKFAPLKGNIAEFAIFDRALIGDEVQKLHSASGQPQGVAAPKSLGVAMGVREKAKPAGCKVHINGETGKFGPSVPRGFPTAFKGSWSESEKLSKIESTKSGRLELAKWLTRPDHPQTARVMVNRIWLHLFGQAIVSTVDDFGVYGARPSHPMLLDHLAERFVQEGWSVKQLVRAIVLTRTYQLDSRKDENLAKSDPENRLFTHHRRRRLDAESLRDSLLMSAGTLDLEPAKGSAVETTDVLINWPPGESSNLHRESKHRSVYLCMLRHAPPRELSAFDLPDPQKVVGKRNETTLPTQSLFLLNSPFVLEQASTLAQDLMSDGDLKDAQRVSKLYRRTLQRGPSEVEIKRAIGYVQAIEPSLPEAERRLKSWASLCQAILASSEFRYID
jgi:hypothetical protein